MTKRKRRPVERLDNKFLFKDDNDMVDLMSICPVLLIIFADFSYWCYQRGLPVVITRVVDEQIAGVSVSHTHEEGRAIDISVRGWGKKDIDEAVRYFNYKYYDQGAISYSDHRSRTIVYHDVSLGFHFHVQTRPNATIGE